ncbi:MAG: 6,7-dimethyl-8-ribityllumazine synthase [Hyphomicrobium sp.]
MVKRDLKEGRRATKLNNLPLGVRVLIIQAPYYEDIAAILLKNAETLLQHNKCEYEIITVEGALEIPQAFAAAVNAQMLGKAKTHYQGVVVLGCIIRGQTSHYEIVSSNTNFWLMKIAMKYSIPLGNGILTVDTYDQAHDRAVGVNGSSKGEEAVRACLGLVGLKNNFAYVKKVKSK